MLPEKKPTHLISKLHSILQVVNLPAHNKKHSQICCYGQISLKTAAVNCSFFWQSDNFGGNIYFAVDGTCLKYNKVF